jgi:hypothetical protein
MGISSSHPNDCLVDLVCALNIRFGPFPGETISCAKPDQLVDNVVHLLRTPSAVLAHRAILTTDVAPDLVARPLALPSRRADAAAVVSAGARWSATARACAVAVAG